MEENEKKKISFWTILYYIVYTPNVKMKRGTNILNRNDTSQTISLPTGN